LNACIGDGRHTYRVLVGRAEGKRPLGRHSYRWGNNLKMDLQELGWGGTDWIVVAEDRDSWRSRVYVVMSLRVP
jgi:hypothetical protein